MKAVQLLQAVNTISRYKNQLQQELAFVMLIENLAPHRVVEVYWTGEGRGWHILRAEFLSSNGPNREIWRAQATLEFVGNADRARPSVQPPAAYLELLGGLGCTVDVWETTYLHVLSGPDAVVRWVSGTGLRPYLQVLGDETERAAFLADYRALVDATYPRQPWGTVLPFRRVFVVARKAVA